MKEYVKDPDEFSELSKGRVHWEIKQEPILITRVDGSGVMDSGDVAFYLSVTSQAKDGNHIIAMKFCVGKANQYTEEFQKQIKKIRKAAEKDFPEATEGAFE